MCPTASEDRKLLTATEFCRGIDGKGGVTAKAFATDRMSTIVITFPSGHDLVMLIGKNDGIVINQFWEAEKVTPLVPMVEHTRVQLPLPFAPLMLPQEQVEWERTTNAFPKVPPTTISTTEEENGTDGTD